ncbi:hypothetical protein PAMP_000492 [Pampus punctatissimus]
MTINKPEKAEYLAEEAKSRERWGANNPFPWQQVLPPTLQPADYKRVSHCPRGNDVLEESFCNSVCVEKNGAEGGGSEVIRYHHTIDGRWVRQNWLR